MGRLQQISRSAQGHTRGRYRRDPSRIATDEARHRPPGPGEVHLDADDLFRAYASFVARFLSHIGVDPQDVSDLVQEVFLVAHRRGGFVPRTAKPTTWLAAIAVRVWADRRKKLRRHREDCDTAKVLVVPSDLASPHDDAERRRDLALIQDSIGRLSPEKRAVFIPFELEGESCRTIADRLRVPVGTVYSRLHAARKEVAQHHAGASQAPTPKPPKRSVPLPPTRTKSAQPLDPELKYVW
ncbi:MAG: RNA polymerase sigma factor [Myxococcota bacterium]